AFSLLSAEGVKVSSGRLSLNFRQAAVRFVIIYLTLTSLQALITTLLGMPLFDSVMHAMTTVSTGGFSPHDESIAFYRNRPDQFPLFIILESVLILFMLAGGINFYVLYRLGQGQLKALWDGFEMRLLWLVFGIATLITAVSSWAALGGSAADWLLRSGFEIASILSTTGYEITATGSFPRFSLELFLLLMILGGCAGSTAGGIKIIRLGLLGKFLGYEIRQLRLPPHAVHVPTMDGRPIPDAAFRQAAFILLLWLVYVGFGGWLISLLAPDLGIAQAYSTVFTAIGVFGPSFVPVEVVIALPQISKVIFMVGMLAGRLEILPLLVFFNPAAWRK
ncbi:MAG: TrkH family potassium uptake protein, partial [Anaerolineales bacterium]|nr:TrkH family potassium uptake protein [Anaerolineales bacterium]